jgi:adenine-specific DNA-methyltransferase
MRHQREALRVKGQFWTPDWVADAMAAYVLGNGADHLFDPAVGAGALFQAAKRIASQSGKTVTLYGTEIDPQAIAQAQASGLSATDLAAVEMRDFAINPPARRFRAIAANPPYIRHHRLSPKLKPYCGSSAPACLASRSMDAPDCMFTFYCGR